MVGLSSLFASSLKLPVGPDISAEEACPRDQRCAPRHDEEAEIDLVTVSERPCCRNGLKVASHKTGVQKRQ